MFTRSHLEEMKRRYREIYVSPEEGTDELVDQYKKETPGQSCGIEEDTNKDEPGTQGDQAEYQRKRKEIAKKFGVESCSALKDEKERKACYAALDAAHVSDDEEEDEDDDPVGKNEEVELEENPYMIKVTKDFKYDGKVVTISKKDFKQVHKDFKNSTRGKERMLINDPKTGGSISVPVQFEEVEIDEAEVAYPPTIKNLKMIVKDKQNQIFMFPKGKARVDLFTASAMVQVYDALKPATKKKFEDMIKSKEGFMKSQAFAMKMAK